MTVETFAEVGIAVEPGATRAVCPQCSAQRSKKYDKCLSVDAAQGLWHCHHCGWSGRLAPGASRRTAPAAGAVPREQAPPHFVAPEGLSEAASAWFRQRGIGRATLAAFRIGSGPTWMPGETAGGRVEAVRFPYLLHGRVVNIKYRTLDKRFRQERGAVRCPYNFDMALRASDARLIVTEGEMDCLALYEAGFRAVISVPDGAPAPGARTEAGKLAFLDQAGPLLERFREVVLAVDADEPGRRLFEALSRRLGPERCLAVHWPEGCKDANDVLMRHGREVLHRCLVQAVPLPLPGVRGVAELRPAVLELAAQGTESGRAGAAIPGLFPPEIFNLEPGQLTVLTGIPSHGKSTFLDAVRLAVLRAHGWASAVFSPENQPSESHLAQLVRMWAGADFCRMGRAAAAAALDELAQGVFFIDAAQDETPPTLHSVLERTRSLCSRTPVRLLTVDPWNELEHRLPSDGRDDRYLSAQLGLLRRFARARNLHVIVAAHPSRPEKDRSGSYPPPTPYDIAGGAMWRNKADNILCVYRPDMHSRRTRVLVQKIRFRRNGRAGSSLDFTFNPETGTYTPLQTPATAGRTDLGRMR